MVMTWLRVYSGRVLYSRVVTELILLRSCLQNCRQRQCRGGALFAVTRHRYCIDCTVCCATGAGSRVSNRNIDVVFLRTISYNSRVSEQLSNDQSAQIHITTSFHFICVRNVSLQFHLSANTWFGSVCTISCFFCN